MNYHPDLISTGLKMLSALVIILGGLLILFYLMKGFSRKRAAGAKKPLVRVLANCYLGVKKNISLVEIPAAILVLGVTNDRISLLAKIDNEEIVNKLKTFEDEGISPSFSPILSNLASRVRDHKTR
ncbi:MAG: flagellar biosynthetic protein FliO [Thermodesulfobacteriota bacterium]|nr:flagellar biosynthetic protein FliO [Thermodesulfobacteriota bacterium]